MSENNIENLSGYYNLILWDWPTCPIIKRWKESKEDFNKSISNFTQNIKRLDNNNKANGIQTRFKVFAIEETTTKEMKEYFKDTNIEVELINTGKKHGVRVTICNEIEAEMRSLIKSNNKSSLTNLILISSDDEFNSDICELRHNYGVNVILIHGDRADNYFIESANASYSFNTFLNSDLDIEYIPKSRNINAEGDSLVFLWDIESAQVPRGMTPCDLVKNIRSYEEFKRYRQKEFIIFCSDETYVNNRDTLDCLRKCGASVQVTGNIKESADLALAKKIRHLHELSKHPLTFVIITGDRDILEYVIEPKNIKLVFLSKTDMKVTDSIRDKNVMGLI